MLALNPLASSFYPQDPQPDQDVKTPFEASLNAYSFFGIHGVKESQEEELEAMYEEEEESYVMEQESMEQKKRLEEARRLALWNSKYANKYEGEDRIEKVKPVSTLVPVARSLPIQPVLVLPVVIQPVIIIIPISVIFIQDVYLL